MDIERYKDTLLHPGDLLHVAERIHHHTSCVWSVQCCLFQKGKKTKGGEIGSIKNLGRWSYVCRVKQRSLKECFGGDKKTPGF